MKCRKMMLQRLLMLLLTVWIYFILLWTPTKLEASTHKSAKTNAATDFVPPGHDLLTSY